MTDAKLLHVACTRECNTQQTPPNTAQAVATGTQQLSLKDLSLLVLARNKTGNRQAIQGQDTTQQTVSEKPSNVAPEILAKEMEPENKTTKKKTPALEIFPGSSKVEDVAPLDAGGLPGGLTWPEVEQSANELEIDLADPVMFKGLVEMLTDKHYLDKGQVPPSYTSTTYCKGCKTTVPIFESCPETVAACPWCHRKNRHNSNVAFATQ